MGKLVRMLQYKVLTRVFSEERAYRAIAAMMFATFTVCGTTAALLLYGVHLVALGLLGGLPCLVAVYHFSCIVIGMYIAKSYLASHPVSVGYSGAYTHTYTQWLVTTLEEHDYVMIYVVQYFMVAITILVIVLDVTAHSLILGAMCYVVVRVVIVQCEPWMLGHRLQGGVVTRVGQIWRAVYIDTISARMVVCRYANVFGSSPRDDIEK